MLLTLEVMGAHAERLGANRRRLFADTGGTIGRVDGNDWVLPDQFVSSRHARVEFVDGTFYIVDINSSNGVFLNSMDYRLAPGEPYPLKSGDRVFIEPFEIHVSVIAAEPRRPAPAPPAAEPPRTMQMAAQKAARPALSDPFAPEPEVPFIGTEPAPSRVPRARGDEILPSPVADPMPLDPMEALRLPDKRKPSRPPSAADLGAGSPLRSHYSPPPIATPTPRPPQPVPPAASPGPLIPEDYNPMAQTGFERPPKPAPPPKPQPPPQAVPPPSRPAPPPQAVPPSARPAPPPIREQRPPERRPAPPPPEARPPERRAAPPPPPPEARPADRRAPPPAVPDARPVPPPAPRPGKSARAPLRQPPPRHAIDESAADEPPARWPIEPPPAPVAPRPPAARPAPREAPPAFDFEALLAAAGLEGTAITPELAQNFGGILRAVVGGLMDVLHARDEVRDAFRLRVTGFQPRENNPLKFSANTEDALHNLLVKRNSAYLGPVESFEEAFEDLRAHQMAMLAGLRAAYESMIGEFEPERLEGRFERFARGGSLLSGSAKQRYWELYREHFRETLADADTSFRKLFGEAFARAYDEQVQRLKAKRRGARV